MKDKKNNAGTDNTGESNTGNRNSGNCNSGNRNSGNWNSGDRNSGDWNSGDWNSGNWNSGCFNTDEPDARFFNKPTSIKLSEFRYSDAWPDFSGMQPCVWIETGMMTDEEKAANPSHETAGGYLKTLSYKDAWAVFWRKTSDANKKKVLALPNFDAAIFKDITGIDVEENSEAKKKAKQLREKADELLKQATELEASL